MKRSCPEQKALEQACAHTFDLDPCLDLLRCAPPNAHLAKLSRTQVMRNLKHKHCVNLLDTQANNKYLFMFLELCTGGELFNLIAEYGPLPEPTLSLFMYQLLQVRMPG